MFLQVLDCLDHLGELIIAVSCKGMVTSTWKKYVYPCWKPTLDNEGENSSSRGGDPGGSVDGLWWYKDLGHHVNGEFSMAVIQANNILEDQSQLESGSMSLFESGPQGTFVGIYDGHAGAEAARFINGRLFENVKSMLFLLSYALLQISPVYLSFHLCLTYINILQKHEISFVYVPCSNSLYFIIYCI